MQGHAGFGEERGRVQVIGKLLHQVAHGVAIALGGQAMIGIGIGREAQRHRGNVSFLAGRCAGGQGAGFLDGLMRLLEAVRVGGIVVIRAYRLGDAPVGHRHFGVELCRLLERTRRFLMIEGIDQPQTLIEKFLRLGIRGGDRMAQVSQAIHQGGGLTRGLGVVRVLLRNHQSAK